MAVDLTGYPTSADEDFHWESLLEVLPGLGQCKIFLQRRHEKREDEADSAALDHRGWSVAVNMGDEMLNLALTAPAGLGLESAIATIPISGEFQIASNSLRCYHDHICVTVCVPSISPWVEHLLSLHRRSPEDDVCDVYCRSCCELLLEVDGKSALLLPTSMWQACSEALACEECAPLGDSHIRAERGKVYISPLSLLVCNADVVSGSILRSQLGLVHCANCNYIVGETQLSADKTRRRPPARPLLNVCRQAWRSSAGCANAPVSLYKHRVTMPNPHAANLQEAGNMLAAFTEEAAVGMQLLAMRAQAGHSRFMLLPNSPEMEDESVASTEMKAEPLEIRIVVAEVLLVGPRCHKKPSKNLSNTEHGAPMRAAKVCFRRCACTSSTACVVVVPHAEFQAACLALDTWTAALPESLRVGPPMGRDDGPSWQTSYLPLPPRDSGLE
mmetsp:Transcript_18309/g.29354  ORF Transcript_18309/g.29354 Transcript_18309/m.29354 type:complete len:444 (+) Transcript_18309:49-1380(+)